MPWSSTICRVRSPVKERAAVEKISTSVIQRVNLRMLSREIKTKTEAGKEGRVESAKGEQWEDVDAKIKAEIDPIRTATDRKLKEAKRNSKTQDEHMKTVSVRNRRVESSQKRQYRRVNQIAMTANLKLQVAKKVAENQDVDESEEYLLDQIARVDLDPKADRDPNPDRNHAVSPDQDQKVVHDRVQGPKAHPAPDRGHAAFRNRDLALVPKAIRGLALVQRVDRVPDPDPFRSHRQIKDRSHVACLDHGPDLRADPVHDRTADRYLDLPAGRDLKVIRNLKAGRDLKVLPDLKVDRDQDLKVVRDNVFDCCCMYCFCKVDTGNVMGMLLNI